MTTKSTTTILFLLLMSFALMTATHAISSASDKILIQQPHRQIVENGNIRMTGTGSTGNLEDQQDDDGMDDDDAAGDDDTDDDDDADADSDGDDDRGDDEDEGAADDDYAGIDTGDDAISYDKDCDAIRLGSNISTSEYIYQLKYQIDIALEIDGDVTATLARLEDFLQMNIATDMTGCNSKSPEVDLQYVLFDVTEDTESKPFCESCTNADVSTDVRFTDGVNDTLIEGAIYDAFIARCAEMKDIEGVVDTFDPCPTIAVTPSPTPPTDGVSAETEPPIIDDGGIPIPDDDDTNSTGVVPIVEQNSKSSSDDKDITGAGIFGIVLLFLVLFAFLIFFIHRRRRRNADRRRLMKLDPNDTFVIGDDQNLSPNSPGPYSDEDDSMIDSRYGMYPEGQTEGMILGSRKLNQDVHKCSSATCNLCEARRKSNISFIPTSNTGLLGIRPKQVPSTTDLSPIVDDTPTKVTSSRSYGVDDTVIL